MPSINEMIEIVRPMVDEARRDGERTALLIAINVVDDYIDRSDTLDEFKAKWHAAKALYEEMRVDD